MEMTFHSHSNKTYFHKKGCALGLILKVRVLGNHPGGPGEIGSGLFVSLIFSTIYK